MEYGKMDRTIMEAQKLISDQQERIAALEAKLERATLALRRIANRPSGGMNNGEMECIHLARETVKELSE